MSIGIVFSDNVALFGEPFIASLDISRDGAAAAPSLASLKLKDPFGTTVLSDQVMSIDGSTVSYEIAAEYLKYRAMNYTLIVKLTIDNKVHIHAALFDVVRNKLSICITDEHLQKRYPGIVKDLWPDGETVSYHNQIESAFEIVKGDIKELGGAEYVDGLIDFNQLRGLLILKTYELIFFGNASNDESVYWSRYEKVKEEYEDKLSKVSFFYDSDNDGVPDTEKKSFEIKMER